MQEGEALSRALRVGLEGTRDTERVRTRNGTVGNHCLTLEAIGKEDSFVTDEAASQPVTTV